MPSGPPRILGCKSFQDLATLQLTVELSHFLKRWNGMSFSPGHHWDFNGFASVEKNLLNVF